MVMRGGTSKGLYFLKSDLPADVAERDRILLAAMGSPDPRQIDGMGGADPLTSKVAIVGPPTRDGTDVDYLFLQVVVDEARVDTSQNCGNLLAGIGPFALERGLVKPAGSTTPVRINMLNTESVAVAHIQTPNGQPEYQGTTRIDGVPGTAAPIPIDFLDVAGSSCGALLPTGNARDTIQGIAVTCIDNGMPVVLMRARDLDRTGYETPEDMDGDEPLKKRVESIRLEAGHKMNLGDVTKKTVPKMCLIAPPQHGGAISTRNFIPKRVHKAIGVFGAVSVATACVVDGSVCEGIAVVDKSKQPVTLDVEHPTGFFTVEMETANGPNGLETRRSALLRTARKLMDGHVFVPA